MGASNFSKQSALLHQPLERDHALGPPGHGTAVQEPHRVQLSQVLRLSYRHEIEGGAEDAST